MILHVYRSSYMQRRASKTDRNTPLFDYLTLSHTRCSPTNLGYLSLSFHPQSQAATMSIQDCKDLIKHDLKLTFTPDGGSGEYALIETTPGAILANARVKLWAQSLTGRDITYNMGLPAIKRFLERLALNGVGFSGERDNIRWKFVASKQ